MNSEEKNIGKIRLDDIYPIIEEKLKNDGEVSFKPHGISMLPLIRQGKDSVTIRKIKEKPKILDVIFYRRNDGHFVLHRIIGENKDGFILCGDNQCIKEYGITEKNIIGIMTAVSRDGKVFSCDEPRYRKYTKGLWKRRIYLKVRRFVILVLSKIKRISGIKK